MTGVLSDSELTGLRELVVTLLPTPAQVVRRSSSSDASGAARTTFGRPVDVTCLIAAVPLRKVEASDSDGRLLTQVFFRITLPFGTRIAAGDRVLALGRTFEVAALASGSFAVDVPVTARELT